MPFPGTHLDTAPSPQKQLYIYLLKMNISIAPIPGHIDTSERQVYVQYKIYTVLIVLFVIVLNLSYSRAINSSMGKICCNYTME